MRLMHLFIVLLAIGFSSCIGGKSVVSRFYVLDYPEGYLLTMPDTLPLVPKTCRINMVDVLPPFSSHQIALRENTHQVTFFAHNEWAVRPEESLTHLTYTFLKNRNVFSHITTGTLILATDYTIQVRVLQLEMLKEGKNYHTRLAVEFSLSSNRTNSTIVEHSSTRTSLLEVRSVNLFASQISQMFTEELDAFTRLIIQQNLSNNDK